MKIRFPSVFLSLATLVLIITFSANPSAAAGPADLEPAREHFMRGEIREAVSALQQSSGSTEASYLLIRIYLNQNLVDMAEAKAMQLYGLEPDSSYSLTAMGDVAFRRGDFKSADDYYQKAISSGEELARAYLGKGKLLESERMLKSAKECFEKAYSIDPDDPDIIREKARYYGISPEEEALWKRYIETAGYEDPAYLENLASWLERRKAWEGKSLRHLQKVPDRTSIELIHFYTNNQYSRYGVKIRINDKKDARLLLDSGSSGIVVSRKYAESAKVPLYGDENTRGLGDDGDRLTRIGLADTVKIGNLVFENYPISFAGKDVVLSEDGIIGTDVFSRFLITLDFNEKEMHLEKLPDPPGVAEDQSYSVFDYDWPPGPEREDYSPFRFMHGKIIVPSLVNGKEKVHLILDTGASYNVFSHRLSDRISYTDMPQMQLGGVSGGIQDIRRVDETRISLAGIEQGSHQTLSINLSRISHVLGTEIGGLVGYPFLKRCVVFLDYRTGSLKIIPDPIRAESE